MGKEEKYEETPVSCPGMNPTIKRAENRSVELYLGLYRCWWRMLETMYVGDNFEMFMGDSLHIKLSNMGKNVTNIIIL